MFKKKRIIMGCLVKVISSDIYENLAFVLDRYQYLIAFGIWLLFWDFYEFALTKVVLEPRLTPQQLN